jgi:hypothetical protein
MALGVEKPGMEARKYRRALTRAILASVYLALFGLMARDAMAQGCAMCYQNAAASGSQGVTALRHGILILLLPAVSLFAGIFAFIYHRRNVTR